MYFCIRRSFCSYKVMEVHVIACWPTALREFVFALQAAHCRAPFRRQPQSSQAAAPFLSEQCAALGWLGYQNTYRSGGNLALSSASLTLNLNCLQSPARNTQLSVG